MKRFRRGEMVLLPQDINCIPSGTYKVVESSHDELHLRLGKSVFVGIIGPYSSLVQKAARSSVCTTQMSFGERYRLLLAANHETSNDPSQPLTFCMVTPEVMEVVN